MHISRYKIRRLIAFCVCLLITSFANAQRYPFYNLNVEDGLLQSQATTLAQDKFGHLWIGTLGGLSRYDGKTFVNYTVRNGMLNNMVRDITTDNKGDIWISGSDGVSMFNGKSFTNFVFPAAENNLPAIVEEIRVDRNNTAWCRANGKLYNITQSKIKLIPVPGNMPVTSILVDSSTLWTAKVGGVLYRYQQNHWDSLVLSPDPSGRVPFVLSMYEDKAKRIWIGTNLGLYKIENGEADIYRLNGKPLYDLAVVLSVTEDNTGNIWLGTNSGAIRITANAVQYYNKHNGLTDNIIYSVLTDEEGNVWLSSDGQGIYRFSGTQFTSLDESMGLPSAQIMAITADKRNRLFLGTYDAGLYTFENGTVYPLSIPDNARSITALSLTRDGKLWIGTRSGLWRYDKIFRSYTYPEHHFPAPSISTLYIDTANRLWIGFPNGAVVYEHDSFKRISTSFFAESFITIGHDSTLIATNAGIKLFSTGTTRPFITNTILDSGEVECFTLRGTELWAGTSQDGIICYNLKTKKTFVINKRNGLESDFIYNITTDNEGDIWAGTGFGIHKIKMTAQNEPLVTFYGRNLGITGMESNHNAVFKMPDGSIWFGTTKGAVKYQPHSSIITSHPISIILQSVKVFGENITDTSYYDSTDNWYNVPYGLHLPYRKNNITFSFQAISLSGGEEMHYRYRIDGLDAPWSNWSTTNSVTYSALPPGKYTFRVKCQTASNQNPEELVYPFEIITPFQKTGWFRLIILAGCILLGVTIQYIVNHRKQNRIKLRQRLRAEEQAKIRMRTAEDFHDEVGNKLTRINVLTNVLKNKIDNLTPDIARIIDQIQDNTGQLYSGTRDILWSLKPSNDTLYQILHRIRDFGVELFQDTDIEFTFIGIDEKWQNVRMPLDVSRNLIMIFKEALNNCLKYANAKNVKLEVTLKRKDVLQLVLSDNGKGFNIHNVKKGHGIDNMNVRAARIHGKIYIDSAERKGTIINLTFRLPERK